MSSLVSHAASLWNTLFRKARLERELDEELRAAVDMLVERHVARGMDPAAARRAALATVGGLEQVKEEVRDDRIGAHLDTLLLDLRYAWRGLTKAPGLTTVIVLTLALGIGANTAIFSVVHAMLLAPLPYRDADRLVFVWSDMSARGYARAPLSGPELWDLRRGSQTCDAFGGIWANSAALNGDGDPARQPQRLPVGRVTTNFFEVLGAEPALGRTFRAEDSAKGAAGTILIGWELFQSRFGGDPSIVGRQILVDDQPTTVIGVMPRSFRLLLPADASVPDLLQAWLLFPTTLEERLRGQQFLRVVGRMRPGVGLAAAREEIAGIAQRISREFPVYGSTGRAFETVALSDDHVREIRGPLLALFAGVGILLLIACVNVASLLIARAAARTRETALRLALGASRGRLFQQALVEGMLLTLLGAAAGLVTGYVGLRALVALRPDAIDRLDAARINGNVFAFTVAIAVLWGLLFSLAPLTQMVRASGSVRSRMAHRGRTRATLVIAQIALSLVLLVGAGLLVRAFVEVQRVDPGYRFDRALTFRVVPRTNPDSQEIDGRFNAFAVLLQSRIAALPGVTGVGTISHVPFDDLPNWFTSYREMHDLDALAQIAARRADTRTISPGLFETLGVPLIEGRYFTEDDVDGGQPVAIVDEMLARRTWPGRRAIGQRLLTDPGTTGVASWPVTVIGVVPHLKLRSLVADLTEQLYLPQRVIQRTPMAFIVRADRDPVGLAADVRAVVAALDPQLPIYDLRPMDVYVDAARATRRFTMLLAAAFAASALALTCVGVYGVLAYAVTRRRHELGVRRALGADSRDVMRDVLREGLILAAAGCGAGLVGAAIGARLLQGQLYGVQPSDPLTYGIAIVLILAGAGAACWIPARRALAVSPMDVLLFE